MKERRLQIYYLLFLSGLFILLPDLVKAVCSQTDPGQNEFYLYADQFHGGECRQTSVTGGDCIELAGSDNFAVSIKIGSGIQSVTLFVDGGCSGGSQLFSTNATYVGWMLYQKASSAQVILQTAPSANPPSGEPENTVNNAPATCGNGMVCLTNPLGSETNIARLVGGVVGRALVILGSITLAVFVYGAFNWIVAAGSEEKVKTGMKTMVYAVIGLFIIFSAYAILSTIIRAF